MQLPGGSRNINTLLGAGNILIVKFTDQTTWTSDTSHPHIYASGPPHPLPREVDGEMCRAVVCSLLQAGAGSSAAPHVGDS
jgi:hypothetical protein